MTNDRMTKECRSPNDELKVNSHCGSTDNKGMDENHLWVSLVLGAIGAGMFLYGKKAGRMIPLAAGLGLMVVPYFIPNVIAMAAVGCVMAVAPMIVRES